MKEWKGRRLTGFLWAQGSSSTSSSLLSKVSSSSSTSLMCHLFDFVCLDGCMLLICSYPVYISIIHIIMKMNSTLFALVNPGGFPNLVLSVTFNISVDGRSYYIVSNGDGWQCYVRWLAALHSGGSELNLSVIPSFTCCSCLLSCSTSCFSNEGWLRPVEGREEWHRPLMLETLVPVSVVYMSNGRHEWEVQDKKWNNLPPARSSPADSAKCKRTSKSSEGRWPMGNTCKGCVSSMGLLALPFFRKTIPRMDWAC